MDAAFRRVSTAILASCMLAACALGWAQQFPSKPVRIIVPVSAGGLHDILMRGVAHELSKIWEESVIVENRPGGTHIVATDYVIKKTPPDGYTLLMDDRSMIANTVLHKKLPYDSFRDLAPVANMIMIPNGVFVRPDFPAKTLQEFADYARKNPGKVNYGSFGIASPAHILIETISRRLGIRLTHIPYKGISKVIPALLGGEIQFGMGGLSALVSYAKKGRIRILAQAGPKRSALLPDVPTYAEAGAKRITLSWTGFFVPAATPKPVIAKIAAGVKTVFASPEFRGKFVEGVGLQTNYLGSEEFAALLKEDLKIYGDEVRSLNIKPD